MLLAQVVHRRLCRGKVVRTTVNLYTHTSVFSELLPASFVASAYLLLPASLSFRSSPPAVTLPRCKSHYSPKLKPWLSRPSYRSAWTNAILGFLPAGRGLASWRAFASRETGPGSLGRLNPQWNLGVACEKPRAAISGGQLPGWPEWLNYTYVALLNALLERDLQLSFLVEGLEEDQVELVVAIEKLHKGSGRVVGKLNEVGGDRFHDLVGFEENVANPRGASYHICSSL